MSSENNAATVHDAGPAPLDYLPGLTQNAKTDVMSGFILFLIALPLSLGIAIASGAPPIAGVIAGFIGGILGSLLGGSYVTINGAAAGPSPPAGIAPRVACTTAPSAPRPASSPGAGAP